MRCDVDPNKVSARQPVAMVSLLAMCGTVIREMAPAPELWDSRGIFVTGVQRNFWQLLF
jgi:hypothetical protein